MVMMDGYLEDFNVENIDGHFETINEGLGVWNEFALLWSEGFCHSQVFSLFPRTSSLTNEFMNFITCCAYGYMELSASIGVCSVLLVKVNEKDCSSFSSSTRVGSKIPGALVAFPCAVRMDYPRTCVNDINNEAAS